MFVFYVCFRYSSSNKLSTVSASRTGIGMISTKAFGQTTAEGPDSANSSTKFGWDYISDDRNTNVLDLV